MTYLLNYTVEIDASNYNVARRIQEIVNEHLEDLTEIVSFKAEQPVEGEIVVPD